MDYPDDAFHSGPWQCNLLKVNGTVTSLPVFIQNILNFVPKTSKAFTGLERHAGKVINDKIFILAGVTL